MSFKFQSLITGNALLDRVQANIANAFNQLIGPFIGGNLLTSVTVGATNTVIKHGLGRTPQIWVLCDQNTNTNVWRASWDSSTITLIAGSSCIVNIWVN